MRRIVTLAIVLAVGALLSACGSSRPASPKAVRASIVAVALAQKSVHYEENVEVGMRVSSRITADVTADSGRARVDSSDGTVEMRLVNDTVYVRGDLDVLGPTLPQAKRYAGRWISIPREDKLYARAALYSLTLASIVRGIPPHVGLGTVANKLPAHFEGVAHGDGDTIAIDGSFSRWNEPVHVQAPASSTPIAIVRGAPNGVLEAIVAAALAQRSVHMTATVFAGVIGKIGYSIDVSQDAASERITYLGRRMRVLVFDHAVYLRAAALLLEERLGLTREQATRYAGRWIWIPQTGGEHKLYAELTEGLTFASIIRRATRMKNLKLSQESAFLVVRGTPALPRLPIDQVTASANGTPLPVAFSGRLPGASTSGRFSRWNEPVKIRLPESSTPIAIVRGS